MKWPMLCWAVWGLPLWAPGAGSAHYSLEPSCLDVGGLAGGSANYALESSQAPGGEGRALNYRSRSGFAGQLSDPVALELANLGAAPLAERGSAQLGARLRLDDASLRVLDPNGLRWSVLAGPVASLSSGGLAKAGDVYQNSQARVQGTYFAFSSELELGVANTGFDDFGGYGGDGLPDLWQVAYFGAGAAPGTGGPLGDEDGDGLLNLQEFAFGTDPTRRGAEPVDWSGGTLLARGVPRPLASRAAGKLSFRAVFARRKDFLASRLTYTLQFSGDLVTWQATAAVPAVLAEDGEMQVVAVPYPFFVGNRKATFFRVAVQVN